MAWALGRDHGHVHVGRGHDLLVVDVEAVGEHEHLAGLEVGQDVFFVQRLLGLVRDQDHDDVGRGRRLGGGHGGEAVFLGQLPVGAAGTLADDHLDAGIAQVLGVGMALAAVADDGLGFVGQEGEVGVLVVIDFHSGSFFIPACRVAWQRRRCGRFP
ncbi:hypothetical protein DSECCO2_548680 [anaerobic digester metagenome]